MLFSKKIKEVKVVDDKKIKELELELTQVKKNYESEKRILENELVIKINEAARQKELDNNKLQEENSVLKKEVEILTKAFDNMGFDVKDMKEILNKLVDGIVSKNQINLVK